MSDAASTPAAAATPAAATPAASATPAAPAAATPAAAPAPWHAGFDEETRGWLSNRGLDKLDAEKALPELVKTARNAEKFIGVPADQLIRLPKDGDPVAFRAAMQRLGMPDKPDGYEIPLPEGDKGEFAKVAAGWFHKAGLTKAQAKELASEWNGFIAAQAKAEEDARKAAVAQGEAALRQEFGQAYDAKVEQVGIIAERLGIDKDVAAALRAALGPVKMANWMLGLGKKLGEDKFVSGDGRPFGGAMSPAEAQSEINRLRNDKDWVARYTAGGKVELEEMRRLQAIVAGGK